MSPSGDDEDSTVWSTSDIHGQLVTAGSLSWRWKHEIRDVHSCMEFFSTDPNSSTFHEDGEGSIATSLDVLRLTRSVSLGEDENRTFPWFLELRVHVWPTLRTYRTSSDRARFLLTSCLGHKGVGRAIVQRLSLLKSWEVVLGILVSPCDSVSPVRTKHFVMSVFDLQKSWEDLIGMSAWNSSDVASPFTCCILSFTWTLFDVHMTPPDASRVCSCCWLSGYDIQDIISVHVLSQIEIWTLRVADLHLWICTCARLTGGTWLRLSCGMLFGSGCHRITLDIANHVDQLGCTMCRETLLVTLILLFGWDAYCCDRDGCQFYLRST